MNKLTILSLTIILLFYACSNPDKKTTARSTIQTITSDTIHRNTSITAANAYNNIFLDSARVEEFIAKQNPGDTIAKGIRNFYNSRNYQYAWFADSGLTEQALGFRSLYKYTDSSSATNVKTDRMLDDLMSDDSVVIDPSDTSIINTELFLTRRFISYALNDNHIKAASLLEFVPAVKRTVAEVTAAVLADKGEYGADNKAYGQMKSKLQQYEGIQKAGGWSSITDSFPSKIKKLKTGINAPLVSAVKKRLHVTGELPVADTSQVFNAALDTAVKQFQLSHGYTGDGLITPALVKIMNVSIKKRIEQLVMNMDRMRYMPTDPAGKLIIVNIPEFVLHVYEGDKTAFNMNVVVGKEGHNTTMFYGDLNQVVFSPYWNIPSSIVKKEIVPGMNRNKNYLKSHNMEITGKAGGGLPQVRQLPGGNNSLGKVKFLFPNSFNIYFHDTPSKGLFKRDNRAYSHGCIRLSDPVKMANYLLQGVPEWTAPKIDSAMNSGKEKYVKLKEPVPVLITYHTAWVAPNGVLQIREDIYDHDAILAKKMFTDPSGL